MERSATPTALVERDKLDPSSLALPRGEMESSFSWTYLSRVLHQVLYVLVNLHLESSAKLNCCLIPYQAPNILLM